MTGPLQQLLLGMGFEDMAQTRAWRRIAVVRNYSPVPIPPGGAGFGFKFLLLDDAGRVEWFGRCGWGTPELMEHECRLLQVMQGDPELRHHTPEVRLLIDGSSTVQLSRYLGEADYDRLMRGISPAQWAADIRSILTLSELLMARLHAVAPELFPADIAAARLASLDADCHRLRQEGIDTDLLVRWRRLMDDVIPSLPPGLQHGDLWPANLLRVDGKWIFIDFTECGMVWMPGYDLLLMLCNSPGGFSTEWIAGGIPDSTDQWQQARRGLLRWFMERHGWSAEQAGVAMLYVLLHITAYRLREGMEEELSLSWKADLQRVDAFLRAGNPVSAIVA